MSEKVNQLQIDFEREPSLEERLQEQWRRNEEAQASQWTPEALCQGWVNNSFGDSEAFQRMPSYHRAHWLRHYIDEQQKVDTIPSYRMRTPREIKAGDDANYAITHERARILADQL